MPLWNMLHTYFVPSQKNAYRPRVLHRSWLVFFLALMLGVEGFLMTNLASRQSNEAFLAAVAGTTPMVGAYSLSPASGTSPVSRVVTSSQTFIQQVIRVMSNPRVVNGILMGVAGILSLAILLAFFIHIQIQPKDMLGSAVLVVVFALLFVYSNNHLLVAQHLPAQAGTQMADAAASL